MLQYLLKDPRITIRITDYAFKHAVRYQHWEVIKCFMMSLAFRYLEGDLSADYLFHIENSAPQPIQDILSIAIYLYLNPDIKNTLKSIVYMNLAIQGRLSELNNDRVPEILWRDISYEYMLKLKI